jgi:hypothetical protein
MLGPLYPNGNLGIGKYPSNDSWPVTIVLKAMTQYYEATGDPRSLSLSNWRIENFHFVHLLVSVFFQVIWHVILCRVFPCMKKFFAFLDVLLDTTPLFMWAKYRWQDLLLSIHWLYERTLDVWISNFSFSFEKAIPLNVILTRSFVNISQNCLHWVTKYILKDTTGHIGTQRFLVE